MPQRFLYDSSIISSVVGGFSALEIPSLHITSLESASAFLLSYGFNIENDVDVKKLWYYHRRSQILMTEKLGILDEDIPDQIKDPRMLGDIRELLLIASETVGERAPLQKWACSFLRCMHVFVHSENDLFGTFSEEIQSQILTTFEDHIVYGGNHHGTYLKSKDEKVASVDLVTFEVKPFKTSTSSVIKLLAKPDAVAMTVFDKLGVRFVTKNIFDCFQVVRFMIAENMISFPHIMPDQSSNNLYPADLFLEVCNELAQRLDILDDQAIQKALDDRLDKAGDKIKFLRKENSFSGNDYTFIKFIARKLIHIKLPGASEPFSFFYPFEVQIMDQVSHNKVLEGPSEHQAYKERQRAAARRRLFPED